MGEIITVPGFRRTAAVLFALGMFVSSCAEAGDRQEIPEGFNGDEIELCTRTTHSGIRASYLPGEPDYEVDEFGFTANVYVLGKLQRTMAKDSGDHADFPLVCKSPRAETPGKYGTDYNYNLTKDATRIVIPLDIYDIALCTPETATEIEAAYVSDDPGYVVDEYGMTANVDIIADRQKVMLEDDDKAGVPVSPNFGDLVCKLETSGGDGDPPDESEYDYRLTSLGDRIGHQNP